MWVKSYLNCICIPYIWLLSHEQFERFIQLIIDRLSPHLFSHQVKHDVVNSQVELLHSLFSIFGPVNAMQQNYLKFICYAWMILLAICITVQWAKLNKIFLNNVFFKDLKKVRERIPCLDALKCDFDILFFVS